MTAAARGSEDEADSGDGYAGDGGEPVIDSEAMRAEIDEDDEMTDAKAAWLLYRLEVLERGGDLLQHFDVADRDARSSFDRAFRAFRDHLRDKGDA